MLMTAPSQKSSKLKGPEMKQINIASIPADGIGPEVISAGIEVVQAVCERTPELALNFTHFDWGSDYYKTHGAMMPADGLDTLKGFDAIFFGAVGAPDVPDHITLCGLRLQICQDLTNMPMSGRPKSSKELTLLCEKRVWRSGLGDCA